MNPLFVKKNKKKKKKKKNKREAKKRAAANVSPTQYALAGTCFIDGSDGMTEGFLTGVA